MHTPYLTAASLIRLLGLPVCLKFHVTTLGGGGLCQKDMKLGQTAGRSCALIEIPVLKYCGMLQVLSFPDPGRHADPGELAIARMLLTHYTAVMVLTCTKSK